MLLGSEFELLSMIAKSYTVYHDGVFRLSKVNFEEKFPEVPPMTLLRLEALGFLKLSDGQVLVNGNAWARFFVLTLETSLKEIGYFFSCEYVEEEQQLTVSDNSKSKKKFHLNFKQEDFDKFQDAINLCYIDTFEFHLFWIDLLNDKNLLQLFAKYVKNEIVRMEYLYRPIFSFFEGLPLEDLSRIYNESIKEYFRQGGFEIQADMSSELAGRVYNLTAKDAIDAYNVKIYGFDVVVIKLENRIEFLSFYDKELRYNEAIRNQIGTLRSILEKKVSLYRDLSMVNRHKVISNIKQIVEVVSVLLVALNGTLLYAISNGLKQIAGISTNIQVIVAVAIFQLVVSLAIAWWVVIPAIRLSTFNWRIKFKS